MQSTIKLSGEPTMYAIMFFAFVFIGIIGAPMVIDACQQFIGSLQNYFLAFAREMEHLYAIHS